MPQDEKAAALTDGLKAVLDSSLNTFMPYIETHNETDLGFDFSITRGDGESLDGEIGYKPGTEETRCSTAGLFFSITLPNNATASCHASEIEGGDMQAHLERLEQRSCLVTSLITMWFEQAPVRPCPNHQHPRPL